MLEKQKIITPRVHRELNIHSRGELLDFSQELRKTNNSFTPQKHGNVDFTILSCREVALAYRNSPDDSLLKTLSPAEYQSIIAREMLSDATFKQPLKAKIKEIRGERLVDIYEDRGNRFVSINLESSILETERGRIVEIMRYLTGVTLENKPVRLILGTTADSYDSPYLQEEADELLNSGDFDVLEFGLNEGVVAMDYRTPIIKPKRAEQVND